MTTDDSEQLSESEQATESGLSESTSQDGGLSPVKDIDERPIGACHLEMLEIKAAVEALRVATARAKAASAAFWKCRDAALEAVPTASAINWRSRATTASFEFIANEIDAVEKMIETP